MVEAAKGLRDFSRTNPLLVIKGGVLDGKAISPADIERLADLEPREVLLAKLAGDMKASMAKAAAVFNALPVQMAQLAEALRAKLEAEGGAAAPAAGVRDRTRRRTPRAGGRPRRRRPRLPEAPARSRQRVSDQPQLGAVAASEQAQKQEKRRSTHGEDQH